MNIWLVSREYAGIAEAGGVKNVSCSLSETLVHLGNKVTLFIPVYGCTDLSHLDFFREYAYPEANISCCGKTYTVGYAQGRMNGVNIVFVCHPLFAEKKAVYVYTREEEKENPLHKSAEGHLDSKLLNILFQRAVASFGHGLDRNLIPDIIHCQDATTALIPSFVMGDELYSETKCVVTIHNAGPGYHHEFGSLDEAFEYTGLDREFLRKGLNGCCVEPFLLSAQNAVLTTVSPQYADEIMTGRTETAGLSESFNRIGVEIIGITNGIDIAKYDPMDMNASLLPVTFDPFNRKLAGKYECRRILLEEYAGSETSGILRSGIEQYGYLSPENGPTAYFGYHGRLVSQKGIKVLAEAAGAILQKNLAAKFIFIGQGQKDLEMDLLHLALNYEGRCVCFRGYDRKLSRLCIAASDFMTFPSYFEPCGLEDFIAQIYGTIPVAHATGGLCKIVNQETGFLYSPNQPKYLEDIMYSLIKIKTTEAHIFNNMITYAANYVKENYSWSVVGEKYQKLYLSLIEH